jgi:hypothetical protein
MVRELVTGFFLGLFIRPNKKKAQVADAASQTDEVPLIPKRTFWGLFYY